MPKVALIDIVNLDQVVTHQHYEWADKPEISLSVKLTLDSSVEWLDVSKQEASALRQYYSPYNLNTFNTHMLVIVDDPADVKATLKSILKKARDKAALEKKKEQKREEAAKKRAATREANRKKRELAKLKELEKKYKEDND